MAELHSPHEEQTRGEHVLTIHSPEACIEVYQTRRQQASGLVAYYHVSKDPNVLLELGKTLRIIVEQVMNEIIVAELQLEPIPQDRRIAHRLEPD